MVRIFRILVAMAVLALAFATPAVAAHEGRIKGTVIGEHGPPDFTDEACHTAGYVWRFSSAGEGGVGKMSHLGRVAEYSLTQCTRPRPEPDERTESVGTVTFTAANGDELWIEHTMLGQLVGPLEHPDGFLFEGEWTAVGGTGRFINATGSGDLHGAGNVYGVVDPDIPEGLLQLNIEGKIAYDRSGK